MYIDSARYVTFCIWNSNNILIALIWFRLVVYQHVTSKSIYVVFGEIKKKNWQHANAEIVTGNIEKIFALYRKRKQVLCFEKLLTDAANKLT